MRTVFLILAILVLTAPALGQSDTPRTEPLRTEAPRTEPATETPLEASVSSGMWIGIGPGMQVLPQGTYRFIFIPADSSQSVQVTTIDTIGGHPGPGPSPDPVDARSRFASAIGQVTEANKAQTAKALAAAYRELIKQSEAAATPEQFAQGVTLLTTVITSGRVGWPPFISLLESELGKATTVPQSAATLTIAAEELEKTIAALEAEAVGPPDEEEGL